MNFILFLALILCLDSQAQTLYLGPEIFDHPQLENYTHTHYPSKKNNIVKMKAVPIQFFLPHGLIIDALEFISTDGFKTIIPLDKLYKGEALIAAEEKQHPWPKMAKSKKSAGPFYLVWKKPEVADIRKEQWPYMIKEINMKTEILQEYPKLQPTKGLNDKTKKGLSLFLQSCFSCHSINGEGGEKMGPDLNLPMNISDYWQENAFLKLVRNPATVRNWPNRQMPGFDQNDLSDEEIKLIWNYLKALK